MGKIIIFLLIFSGFANAEFISKTTTTATGLFDHRQGTIYVDTPTLSVEPVNLGYLTGVGSTITYAINAGTAAYSVTSGTSGWAYNSDKLDNQHGSYYGIKDDIGVSTSSNKTAIEATGVSTGTIYAALQSTGAALSAEISATNTDFESVGTSTGNIQSELDTLETNVATDTNTLQTNIYAVGADTGTIQTELTTLATNIATDTDTLNTQIFAVGASTGLIQADLDTAETRLEAVGADTGTIVGVMATDAEVAAATATLVSEVKHRLALYGGIGASDIYNSSNTAFTYGRWFEVCGATGTVEEFHVTLASATTDAVTVRVWRNGVSTATLSITAGVNQFIFTVAIDCDKLTVIGMDFEGVDSTDPPGGVSVVAILKED